jgi:uncharacterized membrane protein YkoI
MRRPAFSRRYVGLVVAVTAGAGIGVGGLSACSTAAHPATATAAATAPAAATASAPTTTPSAPSAPSTASAPVSAAQAAAIAVKASPGTVGEVDQDMEPTGAVFDVTIQHTDGSETKVEVAAANGHVLSTETDGPDGQSDQPWDGH